MSDAVISDKPDSPSGDGEVSSIFQTFISRVVDFLYDTIAAGPAAIVLIVNIISFAALMFPAPLSEGTPIAIWAMLIGSGVCGSIIAWKTSLPPIATGIDSPTGAVLVLISTSAVQMVAASGADPHVAAISVMLLYTAASAISGITLYALGLLRWGTYFRFVPYFVTGGFLGATGWFLISGAVKMTSGVAVNFAAFNAHWTADGGAKLACAGGVLAILLGLKQWVKSPLATPITLVLLCVGISQGLQRLDLAGPGSGWYLPSLGSLTPWLPFQAINEPGLSLSFILPLIPQVIAVGIVALLSLVAKVSSLEVSRQTSGDLDTEFRSHGISALMAAPLGGILAGAQVGTSRLLVQMGSRTRVTGIVCSLIMGGVGLAAFDLPGLVPLPVVAGLILQLGYSFLVDAFSRSLARRAWLEMGLTTAVLTVCVQYGYLTGVLTGIIFACVLFAINYARIGSIRRRATRANFASDVDRSQDATDYLVKHGEAIRIYWLSGYVFFGSSERVFERIRDDLEASQTKVEYVVLDFSGVTGADSSAILSFTKLKNACDRRGTVLAFCSLSKRMLGAFEEAGFFNKKSKHRFFSSLDLALSWCEDGVLKNAQPVEPFLIADFEQWLLGRVGGNGDFSAFASYLTRRDIEGSQVLYKAGEMADSIDLIVSGHIIVELDEGGQALRLRRSHTTHTVVGEMGFFRRTVRAATVSSDGSAVLYSLTRENFERMKQEKPAFAAEFYEFVISVLADRVEFLDRSLSAVT
jgi:sulfate permease, SulP family